MPNAFFKFNKRTKISTWKSFSLIFLVFFLLPNLTRAQDQVSLVSNQEAFLYIDPEVEIYGELKVVDNHNLTVIYVSSDAVLVGSNNISNSLIVKKIDFKLAEKLVIGSVINVIEPRTFVATGKIADKATKKAYKNLAEKVQLTLYTSAEDENLLLISKTKSSVCIFLPTYKFSKFANSLKIASLNPEEIDLHKVKATFYTSFEVFDCRLLSKKFDRGPPKTTV